MPFERDDTQAIRVSTRRIFIGAPDGPRPTKRGVGIHGLTAGDLYREIGPDGDMREWRWSGNIWEPQASAQSVLLERLIRLNQEILYELRLQTPTARALLDKL